MAGELTQRRSRHFQIKSNDTVCLHFWIHTFANCSWGSYSMLYFCISYYHVHNDSARDVPSGRKTTNSKSNIASQWSRPRYTCYRAVVPTSGTLLPSLSLMGDDGPALSFKPSPLRWLGPTLLRLPDSPPEARHYLTTRVGLTKHLLLSFSSQSERGAPCWELCHNKK